MIYYRNFYRNLGVRYTFDSWLGKKKNISEVKTGNVAVKQFRINAALFDVNKADIKPEAEEEIAKLAKQIVKYKKIRIEGHTDLTASDEYNYKLSLARARAIHDEFLKYKIPTTKMEKAKVSRLLKTRQQKEEQKIDELKCLLI